MNENRNRQEQFKSQRYPYFTVDNRLIVEYGSKIGPYGIAVYIALAMHDGLNDWPTYQTIADETGMSNRQVKREIKKLCEFNIIAKEERRYENGGSAPNAYYLLDYNEWGQDEC